MVSESQQPHQGDRHQRQAAALRQNLARRKAQARARHERESGSEPESPFEATSELATLAHSERPR